MSDTHGSNSASRIHIHDETDASIDPDEVSFDGSVQIPAETAAPIPSATNGLTISPAAATTSATPSQSPSKRPPPATTTAGADNSALASPSFVLPAAPPMTISQSAISKSRPAPTFLASFNSNFTYSHQDGGELLVTPKAPSVASAAQGADSATIATSSLKSSPSSKDPTLMERDGILIPIINGSAAPKLPRCTSSPGVQLHSEPPSLSGTPETRLKRLQPSSTSMALEQQRSPNTANNSPNLTKRQRRLPPEDTVSTTPNLDASPQTLPSPPSQITLEDQTAAIDAAAAAEWKKKRAANSGDSGSGLGALSPNLAEDATSGTEANLAPLTWLKFHWLFIVLTIIQVSICCSVVWYLNNSVARSTVNTLSRQIRQEILSKVQSEVTNLLVDCLSASDLLYQTVVAQAAYVQILRTQSAITPYNISYLFPVAGQLANFPSIPQVGLLTPRGIVVAGRRPNLINGYLAAAQHTTTTTTPSSCPDDNDGSAGCFFRQTPVLNSLLADPNEPHEYLLQEDLFNATLPFPASTPIMATSAYSTAWPFNRLQYLKYLGNPAGSTSWNPYHFQADFDPFLTGPQTSHMLQYYTNEAYQLALEQGNYNYSGGNSSTRLNPPSVLPPDFRTRPLYLDAVTLNGQLGWTRTFLAANNQIVIGAVKAMVDPFASHGIGFISFSFLFYNSLNAQILSNLKSNFRDSEYGSTPNSEVFIFEQGGLLVATTLASLDATSQRDLRTNILTTDQAFVSSMRDPLVDSGLIIGTDSGQTSKAIPVNVTLASSHANRVYDALIIDESFSYDGSTWHLRAAPISSALGLQWVVVVATLDSDFDVGFSKNSITTAWFSALVAVLSIAFTLLVVQMLTRPLFKLVNFMEDISWRLLQAKDDPIKQNSDLNELRSIWQKSIENTGGVKLSAGSIDQELADLRRKRRRMMKKAKERKQQMEAEKLMAARRASSSIPPNMVQLAAFAISNSSNTPGTAPNLSTDSHASSEPWSEGSSDDIDSSVSDGDGTIGGGGGGGGLEHRRRFPSPAAPSISASSSTLAGNANGELSPQPPTIAEEPSHHHRSLWRRVRHACCHSMPRAITERLPAISFQETQLLHRTFGAMLTGLQRSHEMLQTANESKRRFIRYIFHEVRVPFNAIVLGVEQLREDLYSEPLRPVDEMQDVVNILNEQSKVVARILNDVLSLQKIEDGALQLEMNPFNMIELVCGTLRSFQPLLAEKHLILMTEMENIDQAIWRVKMNRRMHGLGSASLTTKIDEEKKTDLNTTIGGGGDNSSSSSSNIAPVGPLSTIITPTTPAANGDYLYPYQNAYEDSKELQRFAESCSREVMGDRYRLRQVLANFLSNAIKFTPSGGTIIVKVSCMFPNDLEEDATTDNIPLNLPPQGSLTTIQSDSNDVPAAPSTTKAPVLEPSATGGAVLFTPPASSNMLPPPSFSPSWTPPKRVRMRVSVTDTGRGLTPSELKQMFKPYVQFQSGEQQQGKGTGLGLNISKSLIDLHGGVIGVTSDGTPGHGCTFFFEVPFNIVPVSVSRTSQASSPHHLSRQVTTRDTTSNNVSPQARTTMSAAAIAASSAFGSGASNSHLNDSNSVTLPGLRAWQLPTPTPRSVASRTINSQQGSPTHGKRRTSNFYTNNGDLPMEEQGNFYQGDENKPFFFPNNGASSPATPLLTHVVFHSSVDRHGSGDAAPPTEQPHSPLSTGSNSGAAITGIMPTGNDLNSTLQYMSQLSFLNGLAISEASSTVTPALPKKSSPGTQYRTTLSIPHGAGYGGSGEHRGLLPATPATGVADSPDSGTPTGGHHKRGHSRSNSSHSLAVGPRLGLVSTSGGLGLAATGVTGGASHRPGHSRHRSAGSSGSFAPVNGGGASSSSRVPPGNRLSPSSLGQVNFSQYSNSPTMLSMNSSPLSPPITVLSPGQPDPSTFSLAAALPVPVSKTSTPLPKVLVVEDSVPNRKLLMMLLRGIKCDPIGVENGLIAVQEFEPSIQSTEELKTQLKAGFKTTAPNVTGTKGSEIALVLMDGNMPVLDGIRATRAIRSLGWTIPIIAVTGNALDEEREDFLKSGANQVLTKPINKAQLMVAIQKYVPSYKPPEVL